MKFEKKAYRMTIELKQFTDYTTYECLHDMKNNFIEPLHVNANLLLQHRIFFFLDWKFF